MPHKRAKRSIREQIRSEKGTDLPPKHSHSHSLTNQEAEAIPKSLSRVLNAAKVREEWNTKKQERKRKLGGLDDGGAGAGAKRQKLGGEGGGKKKQLSGILPGESLQHYNKRVENDMRPLVKDAVQASLAVSRNALKQHKAEKAEKAEKAAKKKGLPNSKRGRKTTSDDDDDEHERDRETEPVTLPPTPNKHANKPKEFQKHSSSAPRRLNDIAQAPPELKRLPFRPSALSRASGAGAGAGVAGGTTKNTAGTGVGTGVGVGRREGILSMAQKAMMEEEREKVIRRYREMKALKMKAQRKDMDMDDAVE